MVKAIVHIGMPKTGSTSIQTWLDANRDLLARRGVHAPHCEVATKGKAIGMIALLYLAMCEAHDQEAEHHRLLFGVTARADQKAHVAAFEQEIRARLSAAAPSDVFVFSSELLAAHVGSVEMAADFARWLRQFFDKIEFVMYIRRQEDLLPSRYSQALRRRVTRDFDDFLEYNCRFSYYNIASFFDDADKDAPLNLRLLERDWLTGGDLIRDFCAVLGVEPDEFSSVGRSNEGFSLAGIEILRAYNKRVEDILASGGEVDPKAEALFRRRLSDLCAGGRRLVLTEDQVTEVRKANNVGNGRVRARWFPDRERLFPPAKRAAPKVLEEATKEEIIDLTVALGLQLTERLSPPSPAAPSPAPEADDAEDEPKGFVRRMMDAL